MSTSVGTKPLEDQICISASYSATIWPHTPNERKIRNTVIIYGDTIGQALTGFIQLLRRDWDATDIRIQRQGHVFDETHGPIETAFTD